MPDNMSVSQKRQNRRIMRVLTGIVIVFLLTVSPNKILYFVWDISPRLEKSMTSKARYYLRTFQFFYWSRVAINPLIYCFFDTRFKNDLEKTKKRLRGLNIGDENTSRSRSASQHTSTTIQVRARANSSFIGEADDVLARSNSKRTSSKRMSNISEIDNTSLDTLNSHPLHQYHHSNHYHNPGHGRVRSATVDTQLSNQNGSVSPQDTSALTPDIN